MHEALFISYDVPVPDSRPEQPSLAQQSKFLRYDFTPEILRVPYCHPRPVKVTADEADYSQQYDAQGDTGMWSVNHERPPPTMDHSI